MRFYKTSEYAIRALTHMACQDTLMSVHQLHDALDIPQKYLAMLLRKLSHAGLVESVQGAKGGYRITMPKDKIRLADIIEVVEGLDSYKRCVLGYPECSDEHPCPMHKFWAQQRKSLWNMIHSITLADLASD